MANHRDCVWNCGGTDCPAPTGNFWIDRKADALRKIRHQPFFTLRTRGKVYPRNPWPVTPNERANPASAAGAKSGEPKANEG